MKIYFFVNNKEGYYKNGKFVEPFFSCTAETIQEADKQLLEATGVDVMKAPWIGVKSEKIP